MTWKTPGKMLDLVLDEAKCSVCRDGTIAIVRASDNRFVMNTTILELLYIIQEYQRHGGVIRVEISLADWRGVEGLP